MIKELKDDLNEVVQMLSDAEFMFEDKNTRSIDDIIKNLMDIKISLKNIKYRVSDIIEYYCDHVEEV